MSLHPKIKCLITLGVLIAVSCFSFNFPSTPNQEALVIITASQGGELTLPDNTVLKIPAGSLQTDTQVSLRRTTVEDSPAGSEELSIVGGIYDINLGTASLE
jgi:hypothetical protein